jgi:uncharacterized protein YjiS (DUF1127 family)
MHCARKGRLLIIYNMGKFASRSVHMHKQELTMSNLIQTANPEVGSAWRAAFVALGAALTASVSAMFAMQERARERARMAELDADALKDMGLTRGDVERHLQKSNWWC